MIKGIGWLQNILKTNLYSRDQHGIMNRYVQEKECWSGHLENTKKCIIDFASKQPGGRIALLGSGWLLDVPMGFLLSKFDEVHLYDIVHPRQIIHHYKKQNKVIFKVQDLTFGMVDNFKEINSTQKLLEFEVDDNSTRVFQDFDVVISLNLLNQLDILLVDQIRKRLSFEKSDEDLLRKLIQQNHINALPNGKTCLISDVREVTFSKDDKFISKKNLIHGKLPKQNKVNEWLWDFDTKGSYHKNVKTKFEVEAYHL